ncbi:MAG: hypothetical protein J7J99_05820 [Thermoprotei archaeon]|nr:hypothetical protein [Thermoprotei archaeon]
MFMFVIEHLEPVVSKWVWFEYKHASKLVGRNRLIITNVENEKEAQKLKEIAYVSRMSIADVGTNPARILILDPKAEKELVTDDFKGIDFVVIGGIMGDHPPRGRTYDLLTKRIPNSKVRNLGKEQFSVDGAIYMALMISKGYKLKEIPIKVGIEIRVNEYLTIELPFAYPLVNGRPLISKELVEYLKKDIDKDEAEYIRLGYVKSIVEY